MRECRPARETYMVLSLANAVALFNKWKDDSAEVLVVSESPFQQSRRGVLEQGIDWAFGLQGQALGGMETFHQRQQNIRAPYLENVQLKYRVACCGRCDTHKCGLRVFLAS